MSALNLLDTTVREIQTMNECIVQNSTIAIASKNFTADLIFNCKHEFISNKLSADIIM